MPVSVPVEGKAHPAAGLAFSYVSEKSHEESQENSNASVYENVKPQISFPFRMTW